MMIAYGTLIKPINIQQAKPPITLQKPTNQNREIVWVNYKYVRSGRHTRFKKSILITVIHRSSQSIGLQGQFCDDDKNHQRHQQPKNNQIHS